MITKSKELKIYGIVLILFGIIDLVYLYMDILDVSSLLGNQSKAVVICVYAFFALCFLITLAKFWMGRQALYYAKGTGKGTSHILLAKIGIVSSILILLSDGVACFNGTASIVEVCSSIVSLSIIYSYYKAAKACL